MNLIHWAEQRTKALNMWDIGALKIYCVLFGMVVGAYLSSFVRDHVWWFVGVVLVLGGYLGFKWFTAGPR